MDTSVSPSTLSLTTTGRAWSIVIVLTMRMLVHSYGPFTPIWDNDSDTVLIENNGVAPDWGYNPFLSNSIVFNEDGIASIIAELSQC